MIIKSSKKRKFFFIIYNYLKKIRLAKYTIYISIAIIIFLSGSLTGGVAIQTFKVGFPYKYKIINTFTTIKNIPRTINSKFSNKSEIIYFDVNLINLQKLEKERTKQLANRYNLKSASSYVNAKIRNKNKLLTANIRLKGDASLGNFAGNKKWSLRVKISGDDALFGIRKFSIQKPESLEYIYEWLFNKAFAAEGGISKRYRFVRVYFNGTYWGVMTFHEHFEDILLENNQRRAGPIIRFDTDQRIAAIIKNYDIGQSFGKTSTLPITHYQRKRSNADSEFNDEYLVAASLLEGLRRGSLTASEALDVEKFAIYTALIDLFDGYHGLVDGNMAFYYNPITSLLEPIAEDIHSGIHRTSRLAITIADGFLTSSKSLWSDWKFIIDNRIILQSLFRDINFIKRYTYYLSKFSNENYLKSFFNSIEDELNSELKALYAEYPLYSFDRNNNTLTRNQSKIKNELNPPVGLLGYLRNNDEQNIYLDIGTNQYFPLNILSISYKNNLHFTIKNKKTMLPGKVKYELISYEELIAEIPKGILLTDEIKKNLHINYKIAGIDKIYTDKIYPSSHLSNSLQIGFLKQKHNFKDFAFIEYDETKKIIIVRPGEWTLTKDLIIPEGYNFIISPNTKIYLNNNASILSFSAIKILGSSSHPVIIDSQDLTGQGVSVINAKNISEIQFTYFKNLNSPQKKGFKLFGAVNFYESRVEISNSTFTQCNSEDALNLIRSNAKINNVNFNHNKFDALDIDFSEVGIYNSTFSNMGNDAIDTSGSVVLMDNININGVGDKGLSFGEKSQILGKNISISNANIALAVKDLSEAEISNLNISNSKIGIIAFQKKKEFGPGFAVIEKLSMEKVNDHYMIENNSKVTIIDYYGYGAEGKVLDSEYTNLKKLLY